MQPLKYIDSLLNSITMYKLVLYCLIALSALSIVFGFTGILPFSGIAFAFLLILLLAVCYLTQQVFDRLFHAVSNSESYLITAFILFFILSPILSLTDVFVTMAVGVIAIASKFVLAVDKKHIFNPAAIAVLIAGLFGFGNGIWWVGSAVMLPFVYMVGFLVVRKIRRFQLLFSFIVCALLSTILFNIRNGLTIDQSLSFINFSSPLIFFGTIMLTEPATTPPRKKRYMTYAAFVGILFGAQFHIGPFFASPELALVIGNIFSYIMSPKKKLFLHLSKMNKLSQNVYEFVFVKNNAFSYLPGQYLEWTVPHTHVDLRGNRRYFTIASSPTENTIKLGVKISEKGSSFKKALVNLPTSTTVIGGQLAGDFVLPENKSKKLVFIAGGIGITPFRSMIQYLIDTNEKRDIVLFYTSSTPQEFVYGDILTEAEKKLGIKTIYVITNPKNAPGNWKGSIGYLSQGLLKQTVPDFKERVYYLSGPNSMVEGYKKLLHEVGIPLHKIVTDYFPGF